MNKPRQACAALCFLLCATAAFAQDFNQLASAAPPSSAAADAVREGRFAEAEQLYIAAVREAETLSPDDPRRAISLNNLAGFYYSRAVYTKAEPLYKRALKWKEQNLGAEHPSVATTLNNLAALYDAQGRYEKAEPLFLRAIAIDEKVLGADSPALATDLNNLAAMYYIQGAFTKAEPLFRRALRIRENALGADHPAIAQSLGNYAAVLRGLKRDSEAAKYEARIAALRAAR